MLSIAYRLLHEDYVGTACAKGIAEPVVVSKHTLRNAKTRLWLGQFTSKARRHVTVMFGGAITALLVTAAVSLVWTPADPLAMSISGRLHGPSGAHPFGTDQYGRDMLSRVMRGAVTSIAVGLIAVGIGAAAGVLLGVASGYVGGWLDETLMRLVDAVQGFPAILSALLFTAVFAPGTGISMVAIGIAFVPAFARLTRAGFLELSGREFVVAARVLGAGDRRLIVRHIFPNALPPLIVQATTKLSRRDPRGGWARLPRARRGGAWAYLAAWDVHRARVFGRCETTTGSRPRPHAGPRQLAQPDRELRLHRPAQGSDAQRLRRLGRG